MQPISIMRLIEESKQNHQSRSYFRLLCVFMSCVMFVNFTTNVDTTKYAADRQAEFKAKTISHGGLHISRTRSCEPSIARILHQKSDHRFQDTFTYPSQKTNAVHDKCNPLDRAELMPR